jgi:hypothetical protein
MKIRFFLILGLFIVLGFTAFTVEAQDNFRGLVPFMTTSAEVEKKLGKPDKYGRYDLDEGTVRIGYRQTVCEKTDKSCLCLAPVGTVVEVALYPYPEVNIADLKLDPKVWERAEVTSGHVPGLEVYMNHKTGVTYEVNMRNGSVRSITYGISQETCKKLSQKVDPRK